MKYLLLPAAALLFLSCQGNLKEKPKPKHNESDWAFYKLNDDVHTIKTRSVSLKEGVTVTSEDVDNDQTFDDYGSLTDETKWTKNNQPVEKTVSEGRNTILKKTLYTQGTPAIIIENQWDPLKEHLLGVLRKTPDGKQIDRITSVLEKGNVKDKIFYNKQDNVTEKHSYTYNKVGSVKTEIIYQDGHTQSHKVLYEYDSQNNLIAESRADRDKKLFKTTYTYQDKKIAEKTTVDGNGKTEYIEKMLYDHNGNITYHITNEINSGIETSEKFVYDKNNNVVNWTTLTTGEPEVTTKNTYDANNNLTATTTLQGNNILDERTYTYKYDSHKNWISKSVTIRGEKSFEVTREITYY